MTEHPFGRCHRQTGQVLLGVLVLVLVVTASAVTFVWYMNQQQTRAGIRYRSAAALNVAEAGVHRALAALESNVPIGGLRGHEWRSQGYAETVQAGPLEGRFVLSVNQDPGGARVITSVGQVGDVIRKVRVRAYVASPILLSAFTGIGIVKIDPPPATTFLLPYGAETLRRPWVHLMAGRAVWFAASQVRINNPEAHVTFSPGPIDAAIGRRDGGDNPPVLPLRIALPREAILAVGGADQYVDVSALRAFGVLINDIVKLDALPEFPTIDRAYLLSQAASNAGNVGINKGAGRFYGDGTLEHKTGSDYSGAEFLRILEYLLTEQSRPRLRGIVYVRGSVTMPEGARVRIDDGTLITESTVHLSRSAELVITHSSASRTLPGLIVQDLGGLNLALEAQLHVHGLVYVNRAIEIGEGATFDVVGAVVGNNPGISFRAYAATVIIRYDPAVLGTPGLLTPEQGPVVVWVAKWEEMP